MNDALNEFADEMQRHANVYHYIGSKDKMIIDLMYVYQTIEGVEELAREICYIENLPMEYEKFEYEVVELAKKYRGMIAAEIGHRMNMIFVHGLPEYKKKVKNPFLEEIPECGFSDEMREKYSNKGKQ